MLTVPSPFQPVQKGGLNFVYPQVPVTEGAGNDPRRPDDIPGGMVLSYNLITHMTVPEPGIEAYLNDPNDPDPVTCTSCTSAGGGGSGGSGSSSSIQDFWIRPNQAYIEPGNILGKVYQFTSMIVDPEFDGIPVDPNKPPRYRAWFDNCDLVARVYVYWEGTDEENGEYVMELRELDGTISQFKEYTTLGGQIFYRIQWMNDPWDNRTSFVYEETAPFRLLEVNHPLGYKEKYDHSVANQIEVTYENVTLGNTPGDNLTVADLTWGYRFDPTTGLLTHIYYPKSAVISAATPGDLPPEGQLYDLSTETDRYYVLEFEYQPLTGTSDRKIHYLREYYSTSKPTTFLGTGTVTQQLEYAKDDAIAPGPTVETYSVWRISEQWDRHGNYHKFWYDEEEASGPGAGDWYVKATHWVDPQVTEHIYTSDEQSRLTSEIAKPEDSEQGMPRKAEYGPGPNAEPASLEWKYSYGNGCCGCNNPTVVEEPSGRKSYFSYDIQTGRMLSSTLPNLLMVQMC